MFVLTVQAKNNVYKSAAAEWQASWRC